MMGRLKDIYDLANRYNVSIYALDPRGLAAFEQDIDEGGAGISLTTDKEMLRMTLTSLQVLADNTDGRAIVNKNDLAGGHAADSPRSERVLPARLQLEQGARGRQVPRDQGQGEAARSRRPRAQGLRRLQSRGSQEGARADEGRSSEGRRPGAGVDRDAGRSRRLHPLVDGDVARVQRQDENHLRVGTGGAGARHTRRPRTSS